MQTDHKQFVQKKLKTYLKEEIVFTKKNMLTWLEKRNNKTIQDMKSELANPQYLIHAQKQTVHFKGKSELRFRCYFIYSKSKGRCYVLKFNKRVKAITAFPLGRTTLKRYKKIFKQSLHKTKERK